MLCAFARHGSRRSSWSGAAADGAYGDNHVVQAFAADAADEPFDVGVLPRTLGGDEGKVGARRTADLCFLTPPSEPCLRLSPHTALCLSGRLSCLLMTVPA